MATGSQSRSGFIGPHWPEWLLTPHGDQIVPND
jgi:hypothetical protein